MTIDFAPNTPEPVRCLVRDFLADFAETGPSVSAAMERLAGSEGMISFWNTLPEPWRGREAVIIGQAIVAYSDAISLRPPLKQHERERRAFLVRHSPITDPAIRVEYRERFE